MDYTTNWQHQLQDVVFHQTNHRHAEAIALCTQLLQLLPAPPAGLVIQVKLQSYLVTSLEAQARYNQAQAHLQTAQAALQKIKTIYSANISLPLELKILSQQGNLARIQGHYAQAEQYFQYAIHLVAEQNLHQQTSLRNNLAIVYKYWGRFDAAENLYKTALADLIRQYGEHHLEVATLYHNLAGLNHARRRYTKAEPHARKSYQLHAVLLGLDHPQTIADGAALGSILHGLGQWDEAIVYFEAAIAFFKQKYGSTHYDVALNLNNLAASLQAKGQLQPAEQAYRQALAIKETLLGANHPEVAISLNNLASLLQQTDRPTEAADLFGRAIAILNSTVGPDHPNTRLCQANAALPA